MTCWQSARDAALMTSVQAERLAVPIGLSLGQDQGQNPGVARVEPVAGKIRRETGAELVTVGAQRV